MAEAAYSVPLPQRVDPHDKKFVRIQLERQPDHIAEALAERYDETQREHGRRDANLELLDYNEQYSERRLPVNAGEDELRSWAEARVNETYSKSLLTIDNPITLYRCLAAYVRSYGLQPPETDCIRTHETCIKRMRDPQWWQKQARRIYGRWDEAQAREIGQVRKQRGLYVSDDAFKRFEGRHWKNANTMANALVVNTTTAEYCTLAELAEHTNAALPIRRGEMMTRIRGMEETAKQKGHIALFITLTAPSAYHAYRQSGQRNPKFKGYSPEDGQTYLCRAWGRIRAKAKREGILWYGLRIAEPHHDGTPHWHLVIFVRRGQAALLRLIIEDYATREDRDELAGDTSRRCKTIPIDASKGGAAGYAAKYVSKNIDGFKLDGIVLRDAENKTTLNTLNPEDTATRVRAWASIWGIRQFQFFGGPPVTVYRELRRLEEIRQNQIAEALRQAADSGDWSRFMELMGGPAEARESHPMCLEWRTTPDSRKGRYGEPIKRPVLLCNGHEYLTRTDEWEIIYNPSADGFPSLKELPNSEPEALGAFTPHTDAETIVRYRPGIDWSQVPIVAPFPFGAFMPLHNGLVLFGDGRSVSPWTCVNNCTNDVHLTIFEGKLARKFGIFQENSLETRLPHRHHL